MARSIEKPPRQRGLSRISATVTLAWWQLRLTWRLLLVAGAGVVAAVILVCTVPLYSQVAMSAGLRDALNTPGNSWVTIHSQANLISQAATQKMSGQIHQELQQNLGQAFSSSQFSAQSPGLQVGANNQIQLIGWAMNGTSEHVKLLAGRLPQDGGNTLEVALTPQGAKDLNLQVGSTISVPMQFLNSDANQIALPLPLHIVGIFQPTDPSESFWHGTSFNSQVVSQQGSLYPSLVSNSSYMAVLDAASAQMDNGNPQNGTTFETPTDLYWYYNFDLAHLDSNNLDTLDNGLNNVLVSISNQPVIDPFVSKTTSSGPNNLIDGYNNRIAVARIPLLSLAYLIAGLMLFFVSLMTDLLVDRQSESIAVLRSRGASREQIFSSLITQSIGVGIIAFLAGPLLSVLLARFLATVTLSPHDQGAVSVLLDNPLAAALNLYLAALVTIVVSILAMFFAINRASRMDVLALRRESARTTRGPAWLRMGLDILAGVIALTGYAFTVYITSPGILDARTRVLLLPPMTLVGAVFLLLGCMLLFLRVFPFILEGLSNLSVHRRGATSMLAVAQMARAPRQSLRMTLLLALAVAFGIFSLVFSASQAQRIPTVAAYQVGANFSGTYPVKSSLSQQSLAQQEAAFKQLSGVTAASVGYTSSTTGAQSGANVPIELRAVDANTFAQTGLWDAQDSNLSLSALMQQLVKQRDAAEGQQVVPAIVDSAAWQTLSLTLGAPFTLTDLNGTINYKAVAEVNRIPTISDSSTASGTSDYVAQGGVLVDFATYQSAVQAVNAANASAQPGSSTQAPQVPLLPANTVWLNTKTDTASLNNVRSALAFGPLHLVSVNDLQAQESTMGSDPLYLALLGVLLIGAATALLLGLLGNMTVSWLSAKSRLINFAVMRALGTAPRQIASILTYEQVIVYATAIGLGIAFGLLLSFLVLPAFVFTSSLGSAATGTGVFYITQSVPPIQMIIPGVLLALAVGILAAICIVALGMMVRIVSRPALSSTLRLNGD
jgi:ABC-type antimicrobial peptide transport system permease subunit